MKVTFSPAARNDIFEIADYIASDNAAAAGSFVKNLAERCQRLAAAPDGGRPRPELWSGLRSVVFRHYVIFYSHDVAALRIERILHGARDIAAQFEKE